MLHSIPTQFADMDQAIDTAQIDKRTKVFDAANDAFHFDTWLKLFELFLAFLFAFPFQYGTAAEYQIAAALTRLCHDASEFLIDKLAGVFNTIFADLTNRNEAFDTTYLALQSAGIAACDRCFDNSTFVQVFPIGDFDGAPGKTALVQSVCAVDAAYNHFDCRSDDRLLL